MASRYPGDWCGALHGGFRRANLHRDFRNADEHETFTIRCAEGLSQMEVLCVSTARHRLVIGWGPVGSDDDRLGRSGTATLVVRRRSVLLLPSFEFR